MTQPSEPTPRMIREWAACGIVAAVSRFVPVPLLDDVVKERATRLALARTLKEHEREYDVTELEVLYTGTAGWFAGVRKYMVGVPARVVLFPVRKYVAIFSSVKDVPADVMGVILLARTLHRSLDRGELSTRDEQALRREAWRLRKAYDTAFEEMDLRLLTGALTDALSTGRGLSGAAADAAQRLIGRLNARGDEASDLVGRAEPELIEGADEVRQVLKRPEISALIEDFDHRVDAYLGIAS